MSTRQSRFAALGGLGLLIVLGSIIALAYRPDGPAHNSDASRARACAPESRDASDNAETAGSLPDTPSGNTEGEGADTPPAASGIQPEPVPGFAPASEPDADGGKMRLSPRNQPNWDEVKRMQIGTPRVPTPPDYSSSLKDGWGVIDASPPASRRRTGHNPFMGHTSDDDARMVRGRVFEIAGTERVPLSDVMITDWQERHRTFTDAEGRFELLAYWSEPGEDEKNEGQEYSVALTATAYGYIGLRVRSYTNLDEGEDGFELYLARRDSMRIAVRFDNPQAADTVTLVLAHGRGGGVNWDERRYIVAQVDPSQEIWFTVPQAFERMSEPLFMLESASAPNVLMDITSRRSVSRTDKEIVFLVKLIVEDTITVSGTAVDMQTGEPVPHAAVSGPGRYTEFAVANDKGEFEIVLSKTPTGIDGEAIHADALDMTVAHEGYATLQARIEATTLRADETGGLRLGPGGNLTGPWTFQMRRWVSATIDCGFLPAGQREGASLRIASELVDAPVQDEGEHAVDANGICEFARIPWGTETLRMRTLVPEVGWRNLTIPKAAWNSPGPYAFTPTSSD